MARWGLERDGRRGEAYFNNLVLKEDGQDGINLGIMAEVGLLNFLAYYAVMVKRNGSVLLEDSKVKEKVS